MLKLKRYPIETNLCLLAILTGSTTSHSNIYILFPTKMQKGNPDEMDLPLLKNDITGSEPNSKLKINSR